MGLKILLSILLILNLTGCATTKKETKMPQIQELRSQINDLEAQLKQRDEEIIGLENELSAAERAKSVSVKSLVSSDVNKVSSKEIQTALTNAGFYNGKIDGKIGKNTKRAIIAFQSANGLTADGVVGSRTWSKLKTYAQ